MNPSLKRTRLVGMLVLAWGTACGAEPVQPQTGAYTVVSQMVLPHLDEMRRLSETQTVCVRGRDITPLFPVFVQPALTGCRLEKRAAAAQSVDYELVCDAVNGASGQAQLALKDGRLRGTLHAKMGGKNMTFSQFITAEYAGPCDAAL